MAKHSKARARTACPETERVKEIEDAWMKSLPAATAEAFARSVKAARERPPRERPADMAKGTLPRPPRPGHEPRPPKDTGRPSGVRQVDAEAQGHLPDAPQPEEGAAASDTPEPIYVRPTVVAIDMRAAAGRDLAIGDRVRIIGSGLYNGEAAVVESLPGGVIPSALVRTEAGRTRRVRTIDLEKIPAQN